MPAKPTSSSDVHDVAAAVLSRVGPAEAMRLQKLVYYSQAWHLALVDEPLFTEAIEAWRDGPVTVALWERHRGQRVIRNWPSGDPGRLGATALKVVSLVCQVYGGLSGDDLSELTHNELPWRIARGGLPDHEPSKAPIQNVEMKRFYRRRSLAGWHTADLMSGGLHGAVDAELGEVERRQLLAEIREDFRHRDPDYDPGPSDPPVSAFDANCGHAEQPRVAVRIDRERPRRAGSTPRD